MKQDPSENQDRNLINNENVKNQKLRAILNDLNLTPEQTTDDIKILGNRDLEILNDVPPHHGD